jgi:hypothetical protein
MKNVPEGGRALLYGGKGEEERRFGERREECKRSSDRRFRGEGSCSVNNMLRL